MTIANQRLIFNLVKEGSISAISPEQIDFDYSSEAAMRTESKMLQTAGFFVVAGENHMIVAS